MNAMVLGTGPGDLPGMSVLVLHCDRDDAGLAHRVAQTFTNAGVQVVRVEGPEWPGRSDPTWLGPYSLLIYILDRQPDDLYASVRAFSKVVAVYRRARPHGPQDLAAHGRQMHEVGIVQLIADRSLLQDSHTRVHLSQFAYLHGRVDGEVPAELILAVLAGPVPVPRGTGDHVELRVAAWPRRRLHTLGIWRPEQVRTALSTLTELVRTLEDAGRRAAELGRPRRSYRPVPGQAANALWLVLNDRTPLLQYDGSRVFSEGGEHDQVQALLNRHAKGALEALQKEPGLKELDFPEYNGRVEAMYRFYQDLVIVNQLGL